MDLGQTLFRLLFNALAGDIDQSYPLYLIIPGRSPNPVMKIDMAKADYIIQAYKEYHLDVEDNLRAFTYPPRLLLVLLLNLSVLPTEDIERSFPSGLLILFD